MESGDDPRPEKEEFPAEPAFEEVDLSHPIPDKIESRILVHPVPPEDLVSLGQTLEDRRGNEETQAELRAIRDRILEVHPEWKHIRGSYSRDTGERLKEFHVPGHGKAFGLDSRKGGHFIDLTFETPSGKLIHVQSVDVDSNGKPTERELNVAERVRRSTKRVDVILIPKGAQLDKIFKRHNR